MGEVNIGFEEYISGYQAQPVWEPFLMSLKRPMQRRIHGELLSKLRASAIGRHEGNAASHNVAAGY